MQLPPRLELALIKLYNAFHSNELHPEICTNCAVGNICDNNASWQFLTDFHGSVVLNYVGLVNENFNRKFHGYSPLELLQIEAYFLAGCGYELPLNGKNRKPKNPKDKALLFNGLSEVVRFLCELDNIPNVMDYTKLFEYQDEKPKYPLHPLN
ncbi:Na(+)-translocating NADH-quinone reductase subunit F [Lacinutrix neustonica]|uniref:Na(+)-translocating NADH-quinone reductase subunit F n=1 Tax=Lacinutrix neustonica TaxID=2980107 RepID=A0A9E8MU02_9FLAO|nr:Na(+)-translocating NADH-quinone reductase subunit F [Lacinutrix neustonica]WAC01483.1 Na(+)-translocating NADH-quinone reductase subunit F [Lacinutrix neustonica]